MMTNYQTALDINGYRTAAESWGATAARLLVEGDEGAARTAARQAAKYARVAMQLENGERWFEPQRVVIIANDDVSPSLSQGAGASAVSTNKLEGD